MDWFGLEEYGIGAVKTDEIQKGLLFYTEFVDHSRIDWKQLKDFKHIRDIMRFAFKKDCTIQQGQAFYVFPLTFYVLYYLIFLFGT